MWKWRKKKEKKTHSKREEQRGEVDQRVEDVDELHYLCQCYAASDECGRPELECRREVIAAKN